MSSVRWISEAEFERDWAAIRQRVLGQDYRVWIEPKDPFCQPSWPKALMEYDLLSTSPPRERFGCPEVLKLDYAYRPLLQTLEELGVTEICLSERVCAPGDKRAPRIWLIHEGKYAVDKHVVVPPDLAALETIAYSGAFRVTGFAAFSREANWGLVAMHDDLSYSVLAGEPAFMEAFFRHAGGLRAAQLRYYYYDDRDSEYREHDPYHAIGWPAPEYTVWKTPEPPDWDDHDEIIRAPAWRSEMK